MSNRQGIPGRSARRIADRFNVKRMGWALGILLVGLIFFKLLPSIGNRWKIPGLLGALITIKVVVEFMSKKGRRLKREEQKAERGARAEETVDSLLSELGEDYRVFHDVDTGRGDIDHILITKEQGVFILETKSRGGEVSVRDGRLLINGRPPEKDFVAQTLRNTYWLKDRLKASTGLDVWINSMLVFTNAFVTVRQPVKGIQIVNRKFLIRAIQNSRSNPTIAATLWQRLCSGSALW